MPKVKLTITESKCRCGYFKKEQEFIVEDLCPININYVVFKSCDIMK